MQVAAQDQAGEAWAVAAERERENVEAALGRELSDREAWQLMADHKADHDAGVQPDIWKSAATVDFANTSTTQGRIQRAMDSVADSLRREGGEVYDPRPQPSQESYDLDKREDRAALSLDRANGVDVEGLVYRSSEIYDDEGGMY